MVATQPVVHKVRKVNIEAMRSGIHKLLKVVAFEPERKYYLDTGYPELNAVFGSRVRGLHYGDIIELRGVEHGGKTLLSLIIAGIGQQQGAAVGILDWELSKDRKWSTKLGVEYDNVYFITPTLVEVAKRNKKKEVERDDDGKVKKMRRLRSAEEMFTEMETAMESFENQGFKKQIWLIDSVANIQTLMSVEGTLMDRNMRVAQDRALFLADALPRLAAKAVAYNAIVILINQLREKPNQMFGNPEYSPGGRALRHNCKVRAQTRRLRHGILKHQGRVVGMVGVVKNFKNKVGDESVQDAESGFRVIWARERASIKFMSVKEAERWILGRD